MNRISELFDNAIEKTEFKNLKDDVLKLIGNSCICDVKRKGCKKDNKKKDNDVKRKGCKKDSDDSKNVNNDNDSKNVNNDNDNDNLIDKLLNNKDKLHNFRGKILNNLINVSKLKEKTLINNKKVGEIFKIINTPKKDMSKLDKYGKINILSDDLINHISRMIYGKN